MAKYRQEVQINASGWSRWIQPKRKGYRMMCCDCGLVHEMQFDFTKDARGIFIFYRAKRHVRATSAARRNGTGRKKP